MDRSCLDDALTAFGCAVLVGGIAIGAAVVTLAWLWTR